MVVRFNEILEVSTDAEDFCKLTPDFSNIRQIRFRVRIHWLWILIEEKQYILINQYIMASENKPLFCR